MTVDELNRLVRHRFRMALLGYVILAAGTIAGLLVSYNQEHKIRDNANRIGELAVCDAPRAVRQDLHVDAKRCAELLHTYHKYAPR